MAKPNSKNSSYLSAEKQRKYLHGSAKVNIIVKSPLLKGILTILLPLALSRSVKVDYGPSMKAQSTEQAIPYEGNTSPSERSTIRNPYESSHQNIRHVFNHRTQLSTSIQTDFKL